jgi:hypothetical protein
MHRDLYVVYRTSTIDQLVADVRSGLSLIPTQEERKKKKKKK